MPDKFIMGILSSPAINIMRQSAQYRDQFICLNISDLYRHGLMGPKNDRLRRYSDPSAVFLQTWHYPQSAVQLSCQLEAGQFFVYSSWLEDTAVIRFLGYSQGILGGKTRYGFACPGCKRRVFKLFMPGPDSLVRPDGIENRGELLCCECHDLRINAWRYGAGDPGRVTLQRRTLREKLGDQPADRQPGVSRTRHQRRFARLLRAERLVLGR